MTLRKSQVLFRMDPNKVICELIRMIDPMEHNCRFIDRISRYDMMNISDIIQGFMEYD